MVVWPELDLLKEAFSGDVSDLGLTPMPSGNSAMHTVRIAGRSGGLPVSAVVRARRGEVAHRSLWYVPDPGIADREYHVYELLEHLDLPHARILARRYHSPIDWVLVLEDLSVRYTLPPVGHSFSAEDWSAIVETYAAIHAATYGILPETMGQTAALLQPEEGSQVDEDTSERILRTLRDTPWTADRLDEDGFQRAVSILLACRAKWRDEPRCIVHNDFYEGNVALPREASEPVVLFDWELAGCSLPQSDLLNLCYGLPGYPVDQVVDQYIGSMATRGVPIDRAPFMAGLAYMALSGGLYTLWLLHLRLSASREGPLPDWLKSETDRLLTGGLNRSVEHARQTASIG